VLGLHHAKRSQSSSNPGAVINQSCCNLSAWIMIFSSFLCQQLSPA
jgi:hypothetical protein